jgi:membrane protein
VNGPRARARTTPPAWRGRAWLRFARTILARTGREFIADDCLNLAAQLAYYFFLAIFPALLVLLSIASFFPLHELSDNVTAALAPIAPGDVLRIVRDQMARISNADHGGILTLGLLGALWTSSTALTSIVSALNRAYDIVETRPWWRVRLVAVGLTIMLTLLVLVSFTLVLSGPAIAENLARRFGLGAAFAWTWTVVQWPVAFVLVTIAVGLVFYFGPDAEQAWRWITPGAVLATAIWLAASLGFKVYVSTFANYTATYGAVGGIIVLLVWLYVCGLALLVGAELNAEIEHHSATGKAPGEKRLP